MSFISRQELEFLGEPLGDCVTVPKLGGGYWCGFGGGGGPSSQTVTQTNLPEYLEPYVMGMMGQATQQLFQTTYDPDTGTYTVGQPKPFEAFSDDPKDYVAQLGGGQQQALHIANWYGSDPGRQFLNEQYGRAATFAQDAGWNAQNAANQALGYGTTGQQAGALGQQLGTTGGGYYGGLGAGYGSEAAGLAPEAQQYGQTAAEIGEMGLRAEELGQDITEQARGYAGEAADIGGMYERMATDPSEYQRYMSPYFNAVVQQQQEGAIRQADIAAQQRKAAAARAGAFGGSRRFVEESEADRALQSQLQGIEAQGLQQAYQQAQGNILNRAQLGLQGLAGAQQGLGTALQGGQLGLSGIGQAMAGQQAGLQGLGQAGQLYGLGMQGAGMGLQGVQQQLAGTAQGMQGAGMGLQGIQAALGGYGLMGQAGTQLSDITGQRLSNAMNLAQFQYGLGEQERQIRQQAINQAIFNFAREKETPFERLAQYNALMRGYAQPGQTQTQYQAAPPAIGQLAGLGTAGLGLAGLMGKKAGGTVSAGDGVDTLALNRAKRGEFV